MTMKFALCLVALFGLSISGLTGHINADPQNPESPKAATPPEVKKLLEQSSLPKEVKGDTTSSPDFIGRVVYFRTFASSGNGSRVVFLVRSKTEAKYFYIDSEKPGAEYQLKTLFMTIEKGWEVSVWAKGTDKALVTMIEWYGQSVVGDGRGNASEEVIGKQLRAFEKVQPTFRTRDLCFPRIAGAASGVVDRGWEAKEAEEPALER